MRRILTQEPACCSEREREKVKKQRKFPACCKREREREKVKKQRKFPACCKRERERKNTNCLMRREGEKKCYCLGEEMMVPGEGSCWPLKIMCVCCRMHMEKASEMKREEKGKVLPSACFLEEWSHSKLY
jgi:hypothetical protein